MHKGLANQMPPSELDFSESSSIHGQGLGLAENGCWDHWLLAPGWKNGDSGSRLPEEEDKPKNVSHGMYHPLRSLARQRAGIHHGVTNSALVAEDGLQDALGLGNKPKGWRLSNNV